MAAMEETEEVLQAKLDVAPTYEERAEIRARLRALRAHKAANGPGPAAAKNTAASATRPTQATSLSSASHAADVAHKRPTPKSAADVSVKLPVVSHIGKSASDPKGFARSASLPSGTKTAGPASDAEKQLPFGKSLLKPTVTKALPAAPLRANSTPSSSGTTDFLPEFMHVTLRTTVAGPSAPRGAAALSGTARADAVVQRPAPKADSPLLKTTFGNRTAISDTSSDLRRKSALAGTGKDGRLMKKCTCETAKRLSQSTLTAHNPFVNNITAWRRCCHERGDESNVMEVSGIVRGRRDDTSGGVDQSGTARSLAYIQFDSMYTKVLSTRLSLILTVSANVFHDISSGHEQQPPSRLCHVQDSRGKWGAVMQVCHTTPASSTFQLGHAHKLDCTLLCECPIQLMQPHCERERRPPRHQCSRGGRQ